jgi:preprotein translocase subunit SecD
MKLTMRMWILGFALAISIISIINAEGSTRFLIFLLLIGILFVLTLIKSNSAKVFIILIFIATTAFLIVSSFETGVVINSVEQDSQAFSQGIRQGQVITSVNNIPVLTPLDYSNAIDQTFISSEDVRLDIVTNSGAFTFFTNESPQITVEEIPKTKIKTGLDISGGARALVQPDFPITEAELQDLIAVSRNRFNVFGIADVNLKGVTDLSGDKFMLVEVAGATQKDLEDLLSQQGKFEAIIGDDVAFIGGDKDITNVCRNDATCASITGCQQVQGGYVCSYSFSISLSPEAAERHADITRDIPTDVETGGQYLTENLTLMLDDSPVQSLLISSNLKGQVTTQISIQGSGQGITQDEAYEDAKSSMNQLQTILITGSLPFKLNIVKLDTISPIFGDQFTSLILLAGVSAIFFVGIIVFIRYRKLKISLALLLTAFSELLIILGIAALINWNLDLPSIAGILATVGTGVDQQIVILDEARTGKHTSLKGRMKRALFVVFTAYLTSLVALLPLYWAGAGLFKGFALTSIIGITAGVFITRPAFADMIKKLEE